MFFHYGKLYMTKFTISDILSVQFSGILYVHTVVQPSPLFIFRTFSSSLTDIFFPQLHLLFLFTKIICVQCRQFGKKKKNTHTEKHKGKMKISRNFTNLLASVDKKEMKRYLRVRRPTHLPGSEDMSRGVLWEMVSNVKSEDILNISIFSIFLKRG